MNPAVRRRFGKPASWATVFALVVSVDQIAKCAVRAFSAPGDGEGFFAIAPRVAPGSLFGIPFRFLPAWMPPPLFHSALLGIATFFLVRHVRTRADGGAGIAAALILAGGTGNLLDRFRWGGVLDFLSLGWPGFAPRWPAFNPADAAICGGVALLVWREARAGRPPIHQEEVRR